MARSMPLISPSCVCRAGGQEGGRADRRRMWALLRWRWRAMRQGSPCARQGRHLLCLDEVDTLAQHAQLVFAKLCVAVLRILRQPRTPLRLQGLFVSSAPRSCQLLRVVIGAHHPRQASGADPPRRVDIYRRTGVQAGGVP